MIAAADTSPLNYLVLIGAIECLPSLFEQVIVPTAVVSELSSSAAPSSVREWIRTSHSWMVVREPHDLTKVSDRLDLGEREAIALACDASVERLLIDDLAGRHEAIRHGIKVVGTLGVLLAAAQAQVLDLEEMVSKLESTSFRMSSKL